MTRSGVEASAVRSTTRLPANHSGRSSRGPASARTCSSAAEGWGKSSWTAAGSGSAWREGTRRLRCQGSSNAPAAGEGAMPDSQTPSGQGSRYEDILTLAEAAEYLRVSESKLADLATEG